MMVARNAAVYFAALLLSELAYGFVGFGDYKKTEFSPARNESFAIPITLDEVASVKIGLYTADGDLVRTIMSSEVLDQGVHTISWDGRDEKDNVVPDEVYVPVLEARTPGGQTKLYDPREKSGGEVIEDLGVKITASRDISYTLPAPSRVLIRAGIKGGPMMRSLANWAPRSAGRNIQRWDGMDESRVLDLREEEELRVLVTGFRLPAHAIITTGNRELSYKEYRKKNNWPSKVMDPGEMTLVRNDVRIARQYYVSPEQARNPRVMLSLMDGKEVIPGAVPVLAAGNRVGVKVEIDEADRWLIDRSLYEVAFFIDHQFVSEEEQGYMPLTWLWTVDPMSSGEHIFTVNISAFDGKVGVVSKKFEIRE